MAAFLRWLIDRRFQVTKVTQPAHRSSGGRLWWYGPEVKSNLQVEVRQDVGELARGDFEDEMLV